jgi:hypothetical protein
LERKTRIARGSILGVKKTRSSLYKSHPKRPAKQPEPRRTPRQVPRGNEKKTLS